MPNTVRPGAKRRSTEELLGYWKQQLGAQEASGETLLGFCQQRGLSYAQAKHWKQRVTAALGRTEPADFIPVTLTDGRGSVAGVELHYPPYRLVLPDTTDVRFIQALLGALREQPC